MKKFPLWRLWHTMLPHGFEMRRVLPSVVLALMLLQLLLILASWLCSAAFPATSVESLLSGEGIRWFLGHYAELLATPVLVWIVLLAAAVGAVERSGVLQKPHGYRERRGRVISLLYLLLCFVVMLLLTAGPHALLLSATGDLWPSPFSRSLIPFVAFALLTAAVLYGIVADTFKTLADVCDSLLLGIRKAAPILLLYILLAQFYYSFCYVFLLNPAF